MSEEKGGRGNKNRKCSYPVLARVTYFPSGKLCGAASAIL